MKIGLFAIIASFANTANSIFDRRAGNEGSIDNRLTNGWRLVFKGVATPKQNALVRTDPEAPLSLVAKQLACSPVNKSGLETVSELVPVIFSSRLSRVTNQMDHRLALPECRCLAQRKRLCHTAKSRRPVITPMRNEPKVINTTRAFWLHESNRNGGSNEDYYYLAATRRTATRTSLASLARWSRSGGP